MPIDMSLAATAPPAKRGTSSRSSSTPRQTISEKRTEAVAGVFQLAQYGCILTRQYSDAAAIGMHGEPIAVEVSKLAAQEDKVAQVVDYLLEVGPYAGLIAATMPLVLQLLANHKVLPANKVQGVVPPDVLSMRMEATLAKQAADQLAAARQMRDEAEQELRLAGEALGNEPDMASNGSKMASDVPGMQG